MRKWIQGYEGIYSIDIFGKVYSEERVVIGPRGRKQFVPATERKLMKHGTGYLTVGLANQGKTKTFRVHRLVAQAFILRLPGLDDVNHIDGNTHNNWVGNLEWCDQIMNSAHAKHMGLYLSGEDNPAAKLLETDIDVLRDRYENGELLQDLALEFGVNRNTVSKHLRKGLSQAERAAMTLTNRQRAAQTRWAA